MSHRRNALTPEALAMMDAIARTGSFAAAARELGKVPSALTYNVRQLEDALDVLLFDRRSGQAKLTAAGDELLKEGRRLLGELETVAHRVKRVASGWESQLTIAIDGVISRTTIFEMCEAFYELKTDQGLVHGTRLRLRSEVMAGVWEALVSGQADLAIGVPMSGTNPPAGVTVEPIGAMDFVFAVAPHHPLAKVEGTLSDEQLMKHRAVAVADSARSLAPLTFNLQSGQDVLTVATLQAKVEAQLRCLGAGFVPEPMVREYVRVGKLVLKDVERGVRSAPLGYAWRTQATAQPKKAPQGLALAWWIEQLRSPTTRKALVERHFGLPNAVD